jgi:hypothetical protein
VLRNKDTLLYPLSVLGFYFFWRWDTSLSSRSRPSASCPRSTGPMSTTTVTRCRGDQTLGAQMGLRGAAKRFVGAGIQSSKEIHAMQTTPCRGCTSPRYHARLPASGRKREASSFRGPRWNRADVTGHATRLSGWTSPGQGFCAFFGHSAITLPGPSGRPTCSPAKPTRPLLPGSRLPPRLRKSRRT